MEQQGATGEVTHVHLMVAIGTLKETVGQLKKEIETLNNNHDKTLDRLTKAEIKIAQGVVLAIVLSMVIPLIINITDPRVHFGNQTNQQQRT